MANLSRIPSDATIAYAVKTPNKTNPKKHTVRFYDSDGNIVPAPTYVRNKIDPKTEVAAFWTTESGHKTLVFDKNELISNPEANRFNFNSALFFANPKKKTMPEAIAQDETFTDHSDVVEFISKAINSKPSDLFISDIKWKYLVRSVVRGKNIKMTGPSGAGKTVTAMSVANHMNRPFFKFDLGSTQDPRGFLIGNTHFVKDVGTVFDESDFVKALKTPNAIILLDEYSRAHPEAANILMPVLDYSQRSLRVPESFGSPTIEVAAGVTFIATANEGVEFVNTRPEDRAMRDRWSVIEMDYLEPVEEFKLIKMRFPKVSDNVIKQITAIAEAIRKEAKSEDSVLTKSISSRATQELASLVYDGFTMKEACEIVVLTMYSADGGVDSERTLVNQIIQRFVGDDSANVSDSSDNADSTEETDVFRNPWKSNS